MSAVLQPGSSGSQNLIIGAGGLTLSPAQQNAYQGFVQWLLAPDSPVFVIKGYSGTGKSTLVKTIIEQLPKLQKMLKLLDPKARDLDLKLTATTNKAAENFSAITGLPCATIHSELGLTVRTNYDTGETNLMIKGNAEMKRHTLLFIDEASYIDRILLKYIFKLIDIETCKVCFIGDPAQLLAVKSFSAPVFDAGFPTVELKDIVRQAEGNPIIELSTLFRHAVETGDWFNFKPDGNIVQVLPRDMFEQAIIKEMARPDWKYDDSKVLAFTNKCVINFNHGIRDCVKGDPQFQPGDYAVNNRYIANNKMKLATDQMVRITAISGPHSQYGVLGKTYTIDEKYNFFMPSSLDDWRAAIKQWKAQDNTRMLETVDREWIDLRAAFAQTINKSQGSTYGQVFIDLDDVKRCPHGNQIARMMYVGVSRARYRVYLTGDLV